MSELVADCPRCNANKMTFDLRAATVVGINYSWQQKYEAFCICRHCSKTTIFILTDKGIPEKESSIKQGLASVKGAANDYVNVLGYISTKDREAETPPEHLPVDIAAVFNEGATCIAVDCYNAAATMFRLCVDLATKELLPKDEVAGLTSKVRRDLGLRLPWLFDNKVLPEALRDLSHCIKEDGNDGAHAGTLTKLDAEDLLDFTFALLERIYTEPKQIQLAKERRDSRRSPKA